MDEGGSDDDLDAMPGYDKEDAAPADELGSLISFANLENVLKHIIKKFKALEGRNNSVDATIRELQRDLEARATFASVDEVANELGMRIDNSNKSAAGLKENIVSLEGQLERARVGSSSLEKRLEAMVKEKAMQDKLIREIQDALLDKVAVSELHMFEAKFAGYTTKLEHQEVVGSLSHYTRTETTERISESVKMLATRFDSYSRTAKIEEQLQELRDWVNDELQYYAKSRQIMDKVDEIQALIRDQSISFERVHASSDDKLRGLSDRVTAVYAELNGDLQQRALASDLREMREGLRKYSLKVETDAFQQDCVPKLKFCVESIKAFDERLRAQDDAIQRVDEVLLDKAGKYDIVVVNSRVEQCFQKDLAMKEFQRLYERIDWLNKRFDQYIEGEADRMVQFKPPDYTPIFEDLQGRIGLKADKADLVEMYQLKANRIDADELAKLQDTIHRQLEYLAVTTFGLSKLALTEAKVGESKMIRTQQKSQVLMQSEALWHWILHNEPPPNLETLRPPPGRLRSMERSDESVTGEADRDKRLMDDYKRMQLEKKLGLRLS